MDREIYTTEQILSDLLSKDVNMVKKASCEIIDISQNREKIRPLIDSLEIIREKTADLDMGGVIARNRRFLDFALEVIEFHKSNKGCSCMLYSQSGDSTFFDPIQEELMGNVKVVKKVMEGNSLYVDYYLAKCNKCQCEFKVIERVYHMPWWHWEKV